jgi:uncharacterized membrane protein
MSSPKEKSAAEEVKEVPRDVHIEKTVTIRVPPEEVYKFWRNLESLPQFMKGVKTVQRLGQNRYHWVVEGPAGMEYEWDAEIYNEKENELIAWRAIGDPDVPNAGTIRFERAPAERGTHVQVTMNYNPTAGKLGVALAKLLGAEPEQLLEDNLLRLKTLLESRPGSLAAGSPRAQ